MNEDLKVYELYKNCNTNIVKNFSRHVSSEFEISSNYEKIEVDFEWLDIMEGTVRYLDNIMRNPNRFIMNEEEVVKVELARRTTVESIKHLSKHTNFIEEIKDNGDVRPSKILNINKDESFNTYENRVIYTLIQNMNNFIAMKKNNLILSSSMKDSKKCTYSAAARIGAEKVDISLAINSRLQNKDDSKQVDDIITRIERLELNILNLTNSQVYKDLAKLHVARVVPPIKKTNLILKNVNFQYAMKLWDYLQDHTANEDKVVKKNVKIKEDNTIKTMLDDTFLLNYLTVKSINGKIELVKGKKDVELVEQMTNNMINKIIELNADMPLEKLQNIIGDKIAIYRNKKEASIEEIQDKISGRIQSYINRIESFRF